MPQPRSFHVKVEVIKASHGGTYGMKEGEQFVTDTNTAEAMIEKKLVKMIKNPNKK